MTLTLWAIRIGDLIAAAPSREDADRRAAEYEQTFAQARAKHIPVRFRRPGKVIVLPARGTTISVIEWPGTVEEHRLDVVEGSWPIEGAA